MNVKRAISPISSQNLIMRNPYDSLQQPIQIDSQIPQFAYQQRMTFQQQQRPNLINNENRYSFNPLQRKVQGLQNICKQLVHIAHNHQQEKKQQKARIIDIQQKVYLLLDIINGNSNLNNHNSNNKQSQLNSSQKLSRYLEPSVCKNQKALVNSTKIQQFVINSAIQNQSTIFNPIHFPQNTMHFSVNQDKQNQFNIANSSMPQISFSKQLRSKNSKQSIKTNKKVSHKKPQIVKNPRNQRIKSQNDMRPRKIDKNIRSETQKKIIKAQPYEPNIINKNDENIIQNNSQIFKSLEVPIIKNYPFQYKPSLLQAIQYKRKQISHQLQQRLSNNPSFIYMNSHRSNELSCQQLQTVESQYGQESNKRGNKKPIKQYYQRDMTNGLNFVSLNAGNSYMNIKH